MRWLFFSLLLLAGCVSASPAPLTQPGVGYFAFFTNGAILGTLGPSRSTCDRLRQNDLAQRTPTLVQTLGIASTEARSALEESMSRCTAAILIPTTASRAEHWVIGVRHRVVGAPLDWVVGWRTEQECREHLSEDRGQGVYLLCQPVRVERP